METDVIPEGILVAKKDFNAPGHVDLHKIPNLQVIKACQSLNSRGYVKTQFSWQYYYYILTDSGIGTNPHSNSFIVRSIICSNFIIWNWNTV
jgi:Plectin/S10 domain